ncbi:MAG TPA: 4a-hydroxytetrahydrobiopterin dehydratase [Bacillota bacterium]|nr:4a-hydroxytetrahydrobiopterin dehydratase [Bacillota bacterium]
MERISDAAIQEALDQLDDWKLVDEKWLQKKYRFKNFLSGVDFVQEVAAYAEGKMHHPFISIDYKVVTLKISSWQMKGITDLDIEMVKHFDELYAAAKK